MTPNNERLRITFNEVAELYDQVRPGYPEALFDAVVQLSRIPPQGRILEIGCGTGQATVPFARRGYRIQCVELGAEMAAVARCNLLPYPDVSIYVGAFEQWPVEVEAFDLAFAATAFHWIDPVVGYPKLAQALKPGGALAVFGSEHVRVDEDGGIFGPIQQVYERETPEISTDEPLLRPDEIADTSARVAASGHFEVIATRRYVWSQAYDAERYIQVLNTYSGHRTLTPDARERLFRGITDIINQQEDKQINKGYLTTLVVARRR